MTREEITQICATEAMYWAGVCDEKILDIAMGAMGAASNICAAVVREISPDQFREEVKKRWQGENLLDRKESPKCVRTE